MIRCEISLIKGALAKFMEPVRLHSISKGEDVFGKGAQAGMLAVRRIK